MIGFHGSGGISTLISAVQAVSAADAAAAEFTHVGVVIAARDLHRGLRTLGRALAPGELFIFEAVKGGAAGDGVYAADGKEFYGTQLRPLDEVVSAYDLAGAKTHVSWCQLSPRCREAFVRADLSGVVDELNGIPYDSNPFNMLAAALCCCRPVRDCVRACGRGRGCDDNKIVCSELAGLVYQKTGLLPETVRCQNIVPADYFRPEGSSRTYDLDGEVPPLFEPPVRFTVTR